MSADAELVTELIQRFGPGIDKVELVNLIKQIINIFQISVEDLYINWESFVITKYDGIKLEYSIENLKKLQNYIQEKLEKKKTGAPSTIKTSRKIINLAGGGNGNGNGNGIGSSPFNIIPSTPTLLRRKQTKTSINDTPSRKLVSPVSSTIETPLKNVVDTDFGQTPTPLKHDSSSTQQQQQQQQQQQSFQTIETLNPHIDKLQPVENESFEYDTPVKLIANFDAKKYNFRTMRTKLLETADVLDSQIEQFQNIIQDHYKLSPSDFSNPSLIQQSQIITIGRIVPDNPSINDSTTTLNSNSLALETSRMLGIGKRIPLNLSNVSNFSFFPGQIVCLKGKNASGEYFKIDEILEIPSLGLPTSTKVELQEYYKNGQKNSKIVIVSGPYTTQNDLNFANLENLIIELNTKINPQLIIFFGPFIDITHPLIAKGELEDSIPNITPKPKTLDEVFKLILTPILRKINTNIQVILIPSLKDAVSKHAAYPQDSLERKLLQLPRNFKTFPNPSIFQINEFVCGVSNNDIFKDLKDINHGDQMVEMNRFERISNHIIEQRRFYPLFPGSTRTRKRKLANGDDEIIEQLPGSDLDIPYSGLAEFNDIIPDILIIPSELRFFAKIIKNVLVINPGAFMRPNGTGSFVELTLQKPDFDKLTKVDGDEELFLHNIWDRARVDIIKS